MMMTMMMNSYGEDLVMINDDADKDADDDQDDDHHDDEQDN